LLAVDIRQLRYFIALTEDLHFGRAAARSHIAQPALSQQIRSLERELGLKLVERTSRGVVLTDAGALFAEEAAAVIARFDTAVATMARVRSGDLGTLRIGIFPGPVRLLLPELLAELRRRRPDLGISTRLLAGRDQEASVRDGGLDLALLPWHPSEPLVGKVISRQLLGLALPAGHPLVKLDEIEPSDVNGLAVVWMARAGDPDLYDSVLSRMTAAGARPSSLLEASTPESSLSIVAAGLAASLKTDAEVAHARAGGEAVEWRPIAGLDLEFVTVAAWEPSRVTEALRCLLDVLDEQMPR
jgi:DNA-binding transcriptional LysR family regulator